VRNPLYLGAIVALIGWTLLLRSVVLAIATGLMVIHFAFVARWEERELLSRFGEAYEAYRRVTPRFRPEAWRGQAQVTRAPRRGPYAADVGACAPGVTPWGTCAREHDHRAGRVRVRIVDRGSSPVNAARLTLRGSGCFRRRAGVLRSGYPDRQCAAGTLPAARHAAATNLDDDRDGHPDDSGGLHPALREQVLDRLGLPGPPRTDLEGLAALYGAWCARVRSTTCGR